MRQPFRPKPAQDKDLQPYIPPFPNSTLTKPDFLPMRPQIPPSFIPGHPHSRISRLLHQYCDYARILIHVPPETTNLPFRADIIHLPPYTLKYNTPHYITPDPSAFYPDIRKPYPFNCPCGGTRMPGKLLHPYNFVHDPEVHICSDCFVVSI